MKRLKIGVLLAAFVLALSCTDKTVNEITQILPLAHTVGIVYQSEYVYLDTVYTGCFASVYNVRSYPAVTLNNDTLLIAGIDYSSFEKLGLPLVSGQSYTMKVADQGNISSATIVQPSPLVVVSPDTMESCINSGDSLVLAWNSNPAGWYLVQLYWYADWFDTVNFVYTYTAFDTLLVTNDTSYVFSSSRLWAPPPGANWVANWWDCDFFFGTADGPKPVPGTPGNFTGSGTGFLLGLNLTDWYDLDPCYGGLAVGQEERVFGRPEEEIKKRLVQRLGPELP